MHFTLYLNFHFFLLTQKIRLLFKYFVKSTTCLTFRFLYPRFSFFLYHYYYYYEYCKIKYFEYLRENFLWYFFVFFFYLPSALWKSKPKFHKTIKFQISVIV